MTLTQEVIREQGKLHYEATKTRALVTPPSHIYPDMDYDDAYAIASAMVDGYLADGFTISGKKVGLTSNAMRKMAGINEPDYGYIFHELRFVNESVIPFETFVQPAMEAELFFMLKKDLEGTDFTIEQILDATEYIVPGLEIVDVRQVNVNRKIFDSIADNASYGGYVVGDRPIRPYEVDLGLLGFIFERNNQQLEVSSGASVLNHPALSIAWLARKFTELGNPLKKGELVMAGSAVTATMCQKGDHFRCKFGKFGDVAVTLY